MLIREITGDLIRDGQGIICHQCNFHGVMGAGIAYAIQDQLFTPEQYAKYAELCQTKGSSLLGTNQYIVCPNGLIVANMFCQNSTMRRLDPCLTNYVAMRTCFMDLRREAEERHLPVCIPGYIGCGIAGGDWERVKDIIVDVFGNSDVLTLIIYWEKERREI